MQADIARRFGRNLFLARRRAGFSQEALAARAAMHRTEVGHLEGGRRVPRIDTVIKLASTIGVPPGALLTGMEWRPGVEREGSFRVKP